MKIHINFKKVKPSETLEDYTKEKIARELDKFQAKVETIDILITSLGRGYSASCHLKGSQRSSFRAEGLGDEIHSAIDNLVHKIHNILRKNKEKMVKHRAHHAGDKEYQNYSFEDSYLEGEQETQKEKKAKSS